MKRKKKIFIGAAAVLLLVVIVVFSKSGKPKTTELFTKVKKGQFDILINVTGELEAMNSENISAPTELRSENIRLYQVKIQDLVAEGTYVDSGQYVATLDRSEITTKLREAEDDMEKRRADFTKVQLDTSINLRALRDQLVNLKYEREEKQITLEQSKFEPPAAIRQAQINLDKSDRAYEAAQKDYKLKVQQAEANMKEATINLNRMARRRDEIIGVMGKFTITAPKKGMVIYVKEWNGQRRKVGSTVNPWEPNVATLPDLSVMISKTYVSEIDISKVKKGQKVKIGIDAFPEKKFTGEITQVSNVGEQLPNSDSKVFEVSLRVNEFDAILRPYMTTSNAIVIDTFKNVKYIPIEAIHSQDSIPFVYTKGGNKQIVLLGDMNDTDVIIEKGLDENDVVYLATPEKA
ncbi:MAG TPA: efflux RND transporter periplasmic adaptor subunit, partial [Bacteroidales bacterium]|nr:efflux RND transporter periplasmic adaptor subunit [Bacteroidales bacterium]